MHEDWYGKVQEFCQHQQKRLVGAVLKDENSTKQERLQGYRSFHDSCRALESDKWMSECSKYLTELYGDGTARNCRPVPGMLYDWASQTENYVFGLATL